MMDDVMTVLQKVGMKVFDGSDIEFFMKNGITLAMLMGDEPLPEKILKKLKKLEEDNNE
tara:strand:+ start:184 stop:360 length:177 start_codon:yes stop_codon:yes gene_type:complete